MPKRAVKKARKVSKARKARKARKVASAKDRIGEIIARLKGEYPDAKCALDHENPLQLLVATILSAQCTDVRVNMVTKTLFKKYKTAKDFANARPEEFEQEIRSTGFFRNKTKSVLGMANALVDKHGGKVPDTMDELTPLPGVGRKTANVVLGNAFNKNEGVVVDTHVTRLSNLLALTKHKGDAIKIERDLMKLVPREEWTLFSHLLILHGRNVCIANRPKHDECVVCDLCPSCPMGVRGA